MCTYSLSADMHDRAQSDALDKHYPDQPHVRRFAVSSSPCTTGLPFLSRLHFVSQWPATDKVSEALVAKKRDDATQHDMSALRGPGTRRDAREDKRRNERWGHDNRMTNYSLKSSFYYSPASKSDSHFQLNSYKSSCKMRLKSSFSIILTAHPP